MTTASTVTNMSSMMGDMGLDAADVPLLYRVKCNVMSLLFKEKKIVALSLWGH